MGSRVQNLVPEIVGLSLTLIDDGLTFTLVSSNEHIAGLDAVQYLDGGPCIAAVQEQRAIPWKESDPLDENQWQGFARSVAAAGIASTLSLPIMPNERVVGSVNLYASTRDGFAGHHAEPAQRNGGGHRYTLSIPPGPLRWPP